MGATPSRADDAALVARLRAGEEQAYEELVRIYGPRLLAVAQRYLGNEPDAHDALQDAFVSIFKAIHRFEGNSALGTWMHTIVVRAALMKLRTFRSQERASIDDLLPRFEGNFDHRVGAGPAWTASFEDLAGRAELRDRVRQAIQSLPEIYRVVVLLRDIEGLDTEATAQALGLTATVVKVRLHRARQALRTLLDHTLREAPPP